MEAHGLPARWKIDGAAMIPNTGMPLAEGTVRYNFASSGNGRRRRNPRLGDVQRTPACAKLYDG